MNDTSLFNITATGGLTKNVTALTNVNIYWLNLTINDTSNNLNSTIFFINITSEPPERCRKFSIKRFLTGGLLFDVDCNGNVNIEGNLTVKGETFLGNVTLPNGGKFWDNQTCTSISSPDGSTVMEVCND